MNPVDQKDEWKAHWPLVLACLVGLSFGSFQMFTLGLFIEPLQAEFGWGRGTITGGVTLVAVISVVLAPFFGILIDRFGVRPLVLPGVVAYMAILSAFSLNSGSIFRWFALWTMFALISLCVKPAVWMTAVSGVFTTGRSMALGVTLCGTALAQIIAPPLTQGLIAAYGWRTAYVGLALFWGIPTLLLAIFALHDAHSVKRRAAPGTVTQGKPRFDGLSIPEATRSLALWRIGIATLISLIFGAAALVHQVPILVESGVTRETAAYLAAMSGVAGIVGKLATGWLMQHFDAGWVAGVTMAISALAFFLLLNPVNWGTIVVSMVVIGYAAGTKTQICAYLTSRYAGMLNYGKIFGVMSSIIVLATGVGTTLAGMLYDYDGSYRWLLIGGIPSSLIAGALLIKLGPFPAWDKPVAAVAA